jgi:hypothetical protein
MKTKKQITKEILGVLEDFELIPEHVLVEDEVQRVLDRMRYQKEMDMFNDPTWNWSGLQ